MMGKINNICDECGEPVSNANHFISYRPLDPDKDGVTLYTPIRNCASPNKGRDEENNDLH